MAPHGSDRLDPEYLATFVVKVGTVLQAPVPAVSARGYLLPFVDPLQRAWARLPDPCIRAVGLSDWHGGALRRGPLRRVT